MRIINKKLKLIQSFKEAILSAVTEFDTDNPTDEQILRLSISAELSAINLYQSLAALTKSKDIRDTLLDVAKEEKVHVGEFNTLLKDIDKEQIQADDEGEKEVNNENILKV